MVGGHPGGNTHLGDGTEEFMNDGDIPAAFDPELADAAGAELTPEVLIHGLTDEDAGLECLVQTFQTGGEIDRIANESVIDVA